MSCLPTFCLGMCLISITNRLYYTFKKTLYHPLMCWQYADSSCWVYSTRCITRLETSPRNILLFSCTCGSNMNWGLKIGISLTVLQCCTYCVMFHIPAICSTSCIRNSDQETAFSKSSASTAGWAVETQKSNPAAAPFILQWSRGWNEEPLKVGPNMYITVPFCFLPKCCEDNSWQLLVCMSMEPNKNRDECISGKCR